MDFLHSAILAVGLFALTFLSPGPNLVLVVQSSVSAGRAAGIAAGLGCAVGDGLYAALGLLGMAALIRESGVVFYAIKVMGGVYVLWLALQLLRAHPATRLDSSVDGARQSLWSYFTRGLITDLANAQTVLFFASIFAVTLRPDTPLWARIVSWSGIVAASIVWRVCLSFAFSHARVREAYGRSQRALERIAGIALAGFGARLVFDGISRK